MSTSATPLPADIASQLEQLRDIRLPHDISWWPLADGWWLLAAALVATAAIISVVIFRRRRSLRFQALRELDLLKCDGALSQHPLRLAEGAGALLKRLMLQHPQHRSLAASSGENWSQFLMRPPGAMDASVADFIATAPYIQNTKDASVLPVDAVLDATENWIRRTA